MAVNRPYAEKFSDRRTSERQALNLKSSEEEFKQVQMFFSVPEKTTKRICQVEKAKLEEVYG